MSLVKAKIEATLKQQNKRSENDFIELPELPRNFVFRVPEELRSIAAHYPIDLKEFVRIHNEYIRTKILEEKAKAKRHKGGKNEDDPNKKYEQLDFEKELYRNVNEVLVNTMPENIRERMRTKYLNVLFGLEPEPPEKLPLCGNVYHCIKTFATPVSA